MNRFSPRHQCAFSGSISELIIGLCIIIGSGIWGCSYTYRQRQQLETSPVPEKISAVQLLRQQHQDELTDWQVLQLAIAYTESRFNPAAVGKAQDSGILQITPVYVAEVNRIYGTSFVLQDAFDPVKSLEMWDLMQAHYNEGRDLERAIALHNRAPQYRAAVLQNMEWIRRYEAFRKQLKR